MDNDPFRAIREMRAARERGEPLVFIPIDEDGNDCGPPEVSYSPPSGPRLN